MDELAVLPTALFTVVAIGMISYVASKLASLPVDFAAGGVSLILLFVEAAGQENQANTITYRSIAWSVALAILFTIFFVFFIIITYRATKESESKRVEQVLKETGWSADFLSDLSYFFSLSIASFFVLGAVSLASNASQVVGIDVTSRGAVADMFLVATRDLPRVSVSAVLLGMVLAVTLFRRATRRKGA